MNADLEMWKKKWQRQILLMCLSSRIGWRIDMKILTALFNLLLFVIGIALISFVATFFLTIFMPENVQNAIQIFKNLLQIP